MAQREIEKNPTRLDRAQRSLVNGGSTAAVGVIPILHIDNSLSLSLSVFSGRNGYLRKVILLERRKPLLRRSETASCFTIGCLHGLMRCPIHYFMLGFSVSEELANRSLTRGIRIRMSLLFYFGKSGEWRV